MATSQAVTAWDENGKPIADAGEGAAAWDENGKPIPVSVEAPNSAERFTEVTTGAQHPVDEFGRELQGIYHHPLEFGKDVAQTFGIPREFWSHPIQQFKNIGGTGIPGAVFGEHGLIKDPLGFGERVTGANELSEDVQSGNWKGIPGDVAGGVVNLALLKGPARAAGEQVAGARRALFPVQRRAPMGAYDENAQAWVPREPEQISAADRKAVPIQNSPRFDPEAYKAGRLQAIGKEPAAVFPGASQPSVDEFYENRGREIDAMRRQQPDANRLQPIRTTPFAGASSSSSPQANFELPEPRGNPTPFPKVVSRAEAEPAAPSTRLQPLNKVPLEKRFDREAILDAEGLLHQESGAMLAGDRPGRYYDENEMGEYNPQKEQSAARGVTSGGKWRGVSSGRDMYPFMREHPEWGPEFIQKALRNKDSAAYQRVMEAAIDYVNRGHPVDEERAAIQDEAGDTSFDPERLTPIGEKEVAPVAETAAPAKATETTETDPIKLKYPDPAVRQMVRANGEGIVEATKGNPEQLKAIHDLTRVELRQALINAGEDMGQQTVSNSKFAGEGSISRQEAFDRLLQKGHSPDDIVRLAKHIPEGTRLQPVGQGEPEIELIEPEGPRGNGSGEAGGGGLEEQSRQSSENAQGVKYFRETPGGGRHPLIGLGRQDLRAGPGQRIIRVEANGRETVLDAQPARAGALRPIRGKPR